jgi:N-acetyl-anhydromuramyl-L-alanine amidase AmpD
MRKIDLIVIHCADTLPDSKINAETIRKWHIEKGWKDIGYHYVIPTGGTIERGRSDSEVGAHVQGHNANTIGICLVGGKEDKNGIKFVDYQFRSLKHLLINLMKKYKGVGIVGHCDLDSKKTCPNFDVQQWVKENIL